MELAVIWRNAAPCLTESTAENAKERVILLQCQKYYLYTFYRVTYFQVYAKLWKYSFLSWMLSLKSAWSCLPQMFEWSSRQPQVDRCLELSLPRPLWAVQYWRTPVIRPTLSIWELWSHSSRAGGCSILQEDRCLLPCTEKGLSKPYWWPWSLTY